MKVKLPGVVVTVEFFAPDTSLLRGGGAIQAEVVKALDPAAHMTLALIQVALFFFLINLF